MLIVMPSLTSISLPMKQHVTTLSTVALLCASAIFFLGNSGGAASSGLFRTGAPTPNGVEATCGSPGCHNNGAFGEPRLNITFAENGSTDFDTMSSYIPGQAYTVSLAVGYDNTAPAGYGFQSQILTNSNNPVTAGMLSATAAGVRISPGPNERRYAEQSRRSTDSVFTFNWTAPVLGTGPVNLYASGNLVNGAAGSSGDNGSTMPTIVMLTEAQPSSTAELTSLKGRVYPNPAFALSQVQVELEVKQSGDYQVALFDLSGRNVHNRTAQMLNGLNTYIVPTAGLLPGVYSVTISGSDSRYVTRLVIQ